MISNSSTTGELGSSKKKKDLAAVTWKQCCVLSEDISSVATHRLSLVAVRVAVVVAATLLIVASDRSAVVVFAGYNVCRLVYFSDGILLYFIVSLAV